MGQGGGAFRLQGCLLRFQSRHLIGNGGVSLRGLRLGAFQGLQGQPDLFQLLGIDLDLGLLGGIPFPVRAVTVMERVLFPLGGGFRLHNGPQ